jgi:nucleoside-diphosphate-sugar epimerase
MDKVMMTGATGFIGSHIVREFLRHCIQVCCLVRKSSDLSNLDGLDVAYEYGDIRDLPSLKKAFKGYDTVIHNAAYVHDWGDYELFDSVNVRGTMNVCKACSTNKINRLIMTGSCASYGEEDSRTIKDESHPFNSHYHYFLDRIFPCRMNFYRDTKALATQYAAAFARKNGVNLTILEPVWVFGEREFSSGFFEYMQSVKEGMVAVPGSRKNRFHVIYAADCARAYYCAYRKQPEGVHRFLIGNRKAVNMHRIFSSFVKSAGLTRPVYIPKWIVYPLAIVMEIFHILFHIKKPPLLSRARVNMFYDNIEYSVKKAEKLLGFTAHYPLKKAIERTVSWYKRHALL